MLIAQISGTGAHVREFISTWYSLFLIVFCGTSVATCEKGRTWEGILANISTYVWLSKPSKLQTLYNLKLLSEKWSENRASRQILPRSKSHSSSRFHATAKTVAPPVNELFHFQFPTWRNSRLPMVSNTASSGFAQACVRVSHANVNTTVHCFAGPPASRNHNI